MVKFLDGPAAGQVLAIRSAPIVLRVVLGPRGKLDALDQDGDVAESNETIHVYRLASRVSAIFVRASKGMGGRWPMAEYRFFHEQPPDALARDNTSWRAWMVERRPAAEELLIDGGHYSRLEVETV